MPDHSTKTLHFKLALNKHIARINWKPDVRALPAWGEGDIVVVEERVEESLSLLVALTVWCELVALGDRERVGLRVLVANAGGENLKRGTDVGRRSGGESLGLGGRVGGLDTVASAWAGIEDAFLADCLAGVVDVPSVVAVFTLGGCDGFVS